MNFSILSKKNGPDGALRIIAGAVIHPRGGLRQARSCWKGLGSGFSHLILFEGVRQ